MDPIVPIVFFMLFMFCMNVVDILLAKIRRKKLFSKRWYVFRFVVYPLFFAVAFMLAEGAWDAKHIWRTEEDRAFQASMEKALRATGEFFPQKFFGTADTVCFVPYYGGGGPNALRIELTPDARENLKSYLTNGFGSNERCWWVFGFKKGNMEFSRKMVNSAGAVRPWKTQCFRADSVLLKLSSTTRHGVVFNIIAKENQ
jgi:hypothetical protein